MQPDLTQPGAALAFATVVQLYVEACARDDEETIMTAGYGFAALHAMAGGDRDTLVIMVRDAAVQAVRVAAGLQRPS